jgi:FKBP-type peptidyl-prolyl cis-trans isomerases 1
MKNNKKNFLCLSLIILILASCNNNDSSIANAKRKIENDNWVNSFKDSVGYVQSSVTGYYGTINYYYKIILAGNTTGDSPLSTDLVVVNYKGSLKDGTIFDKTYTSSSPINDTTAVPVAFRANALVYGWTVNLIKMKKGEIRRIILPSELGYGNTGSGTTIPPCAALKFDVQLISFTH